MPRVRGVAANRVLQVPDPGFELLATRIAAEAGQLHQPHGLGVRHPGRRQGALREHSEESSRDQDQGHGHPRQQPDRGRPTFCRGSRGLRRFGFEKLPPRLPPGIQLPCVAVDGLPPVLGNVCLGIWKQVGPRTFKLKHMAWNWNLDGSFAGTFEMEVTLRLTRDAEDYTGTWVADNLDPAGNVIPELHFEGIARATRIAVD